MSATTACVLNIRKPRTDAENDRITATKNGGAGGVTSTPAPGTPEPVEEVQMAHNQFTPLAVRLWSKVVKSEGCWEWTGVRDKDGYGRVQANGRRVLTHRLSWELEHGPIPDGLRVLHECDNPPCVRPSHLFLGTSADNTADMIRKGRSRFSAEPINRAKGERHGCALLSAAQVTEIRHLYGTGVPSRDLARTYHVSIGHINSIMRRRAWKHLP